MLQLRRQLAQKVELCRHEDDSRGGAQTATGVGLSIPKDFFH